MRVDHDILRFGHALQTFPTPESLNNFYAAKRTNAKRHNLQIYLQQMRSFDPALMLVGEAPGYNGCARTGIPFSSEMLVQTGVFDGALFTEAHGYRLSRGKQFREQSASIVWDVLQTHRQMALCWNACCFHPHQLENVLSNRKPKRNEIAISLPFLQTLLKLFPHVKTIVAVGNSADSALQTLQLPYQKVRHPSHGGKHAFTQGMETIIKSLS